MTSTPKLRGMRPLLLVPIVGLVIAGCGSGAGGSSYKTPAQILAKIPGCVNIQPDHGPQLLDKESADCDFHSTTDNPNSLTAVTFNSSDQQGQWLKVAQNFGGVYVVGGSWLVQTNTSEDAATVQKAVGGSIH